MAAKSAKPATKALVNWDERLSGLAQEAASTEATVGGKFISCKGGRLRFNGADVPGNKMSVVVLDSIYENHLYQSDFDADNPSSPECFAFGRKDDEMSPHEDSAEPQCASCKDCPHNQWGSGKGKGKACKNIRRLALIPEDGLEDIQGAEVAYLKVPVMSVKGWSGYVQSLANNYRRPPLAVVTEIMVVPDDRSQYRLQFNFVQLIEDAPVLEALLARREQVANEIAFPYQRTEAPPVPSNKARTASSGAAKFARRR